MKQLHAPKGYQENDQFSGGPLALTPSCPHFFTAPVLEIGFDVVIRLYRTPLSLCRWLF